MELLVFQRFFNAAQSFIFKMFNTSVS